MSDLVINNERLKQEWDYEKNKGLDINKITLGSNKKVWWKCSKGHEWNTMVNSRKKGKNGCPYCGNQKVLKGYNDLATTNPKYLEEWDYEKNDILPYEVMAGSEKKVWWKCKHNHIYQMQIDLKVKRNYRCPKCGKGKHISFPEKCIAYYIYQVDKSIVESYSDKKNGLSEIDIYIPKKKIGIEYDGKRWHTNKNIARDNKKNEICNQLGIKLFRIREEKNSKIDNNSTNIIINKNHSLETIITELIKNIYGKSIDVNIKRDELKIYEKIESYFDDISALNLPKQILDEWDYEKNGKLTPENFTQFTHRSVWWKCRKCNGSWKTAISNRSYNRGCPYCTGHKLLVGFNDLETINPEILKEWDYEKNDILPSNITAHSGKSVWWKCSKGHSYLSKISNRNDLGRGCPVCSNKKVEKGINDLKTLYPNIAKEWDYEKNSIDPNEISSGSTKKIYFKCPKCGYSWQTSLCNRTKSNTGCPNCYKLRAGESLKKEVIQLSKDNKIIKKYDSLYDAELSTGISRSSICQNLKGRSKSAGGFIWKYVDEEK